MTYGRYGSYNIMTSDNLLTSFTDINYYSYFTRA